LFIVLGNIKLNEIKYERKNIYHVRVPGVDGKIHPHQEHMKDTYIQNN